ncbi:hypothetical protein BT63DRAFT_464183 [Microthyrium microscopicum]|uniref:Zn(2)-C6 fungal-type domain-containing protein n=1 Tax=Microthyrium microscopicum TaxID=703497 RepID=A0A6A6TZ06_9PEZI|nr:hypothetical protein BT63DRAFT_464183 [Microthyrium microscopicum]
METEQRRRRRPALSCVACRRRKIKCNRSNPCAHCITTKSQCTYSVHHNGPAVQRRHRQSSSHGQSNEQLHEHAAASLGPPLAMIAATAHNHTRPKQNTTSIQTPRYSQDSREDLSDLMQRVQRLENASTSDSVELSTETGRDILSRQAGLQGSQTVLNKSRALRWIHLMGMAPEVHSTIKANETLESNKAQESLGQATQIRALLTDIGDLLQQCKLLARSIKVGHPSRGLVEPGFRFVRPSRLAADKMVELYFQSFEPSFRILHEPTFMREYQQFWDQSEISTPDLSLKVLLVVGIGSSLCDHADQDPLFLFTVHQCIYTAQMWLAGPVKKTRVDIIGIQIHCLMIIASQLFSIGGDLMWMSMGSLIHRAMQIAMHRDPKYLPAMSALQAELRRRLWATILEMTVQSSLDSGMPARISFEEFDTNPPANINDAEIEDSTTTVESKPGQVYTATSMQLVLLDSLPTRLRIIRLLNGLNSDISYSEVMKLSVEMTDAYQKLGSFIVANSDSGLTTFQRNLLHYLLRRFMIPLHCLFISKARMNPVFSYSLKANLDAAMTLVSPESDQEFSRLMATGGGMFREGIIYAYTAISIELIAQTNVQRLDGTLSQVSPHREILKSAIKEQVSLSLDRIRQGETNIKSHMFLSMVLAQVEALETNNTLEQKIALSARDRLQLCHDTLLPQVESTSSNTPLEYARPGSMNFGMEMDSYGLDLDMDFLFPGLRFSNT